MLANAGTAFAYSARYELSANEFAKLKYMRTMWISTLEAASPFGYITVFTKFLPVAYHNV